MPNSSKSDWAASSKPLLLPWIGRWTPNALPCQEPACQIHLLNHQGHTHIITAWWLGHAMRLGSCGWMFLHPTSRGGPALGGLQTPKNCRGIQLSWRGLRSLIPNCCTWLWEIIPALPGSAWCYPKLALAAQREEHSLGSMKASSCTTWSWGDSWKCASVWWLGWTPLSWRDCSPSLLELQDHIPKESKLFVFIKVSGWTIMLQLGTTTTAFVCDMPGIYQHISS